MDDQSIGDVIAQMGGVKVKVGRSILYAQGIAKKNGFSLDQVAQYLSNNHPEFGINSDEELEELLKRRDDSIWYSPEEMNAQKIEEHASKGGFFKWFDDKDDVPF